MGDTPNPPAMAGLHHLTLTVSDLDRTIEWYQRVLGFEFVIRAEPDGFRKALLRRADAFSLSFVEHAAAVPGDFDERRVGLDHVGFGVADAAALEQWVERLDAHHVPRSAVTQGTMGQVVSFRDPDNIALEFYTRA